MNDLSAFDRLVKSLSSEDRVELLNRIQSSAQLSYEPLQKFNEEIEAFDHERELLKLTFFQRLILFLKSFFAGKDRFTLVQGMHLDKLGTQIDKHNKGLLDCRQTLFLEKMFHELSALKESAQVLEGPLNQALGRAKNDFFAFLAKNELEYIQQRLLRETDPYSLWDSIKPESETDVKFEMYSRFNEIFDAIPKEDKNQVYHDVRALYALHSLSAHPFDALLSRFKSGPPSKSKQCSFRFLKAQLVSLADLLYAIQFPPSPAALRSLSLFYHQQKLEDEDFNIEGQFKYDLSKFDRAFAGIRKFNERVPLVPIIQYISLNPEYQPRETKGGEDWFVIYKNFWKKRIDEIYLDFFRYRTRQKLTAEIISFCNLIKLPEIKNYRLERKHFLSLSFLRGFFEGNFNSLYRPLKLIILKGEFYKDENSQDFTDAFNFCSKINDRIKELEKRLDIGGDLHALIRATKDDLANPKERQKKIEEILVLADEEARSLIDICSRQLKQLTLLLNGILRGEPGARYDTIINFDSIGGRENRVLKESWENALEQIEEASELQKDILDLELQQ